MSTGALDPLIHDPGRLRIVATLAALPDGGRVGRRWRPPVLSRHVRMLALHCYRPMRSFRSASARRRRLICEGPERPSRSAPLYYSLTCLTRVLRIVVSLRGGHPTYPTSASRRASLDRGLGPK